MVLHGEAQTIQKIEQKTENNITQNRTNKQKTSNIDQVWPK